MPIKERNHGPRSFAMVTNLMHSALKCQWSRYRKRTKSFKHFTHWSSLYHRIQRRATETWPPYGKVFRRYRYSRNSLTHTLPAQFFGGPNKSQVYGNRFLNFYFRKSNYPRLPLNSKLVWFIQYGFWVRNIK